MQHCQERKTRTNWVLAEVLGVRVRYASVGQWAESFPRKTDDAAVDIVQEDPASHKAYRVRESAFKAVITAAAVET